MTIVDVLLTSNIYFQKLMKKNTLWIILGLSVLLITCAAVVGIIGVAATIFFFAAGEEAAQQPDSIIDPTRFAFFSADAPPEFVPTDCPFATPRNIDVECGMVVVPANRTKPENGKAVALAVAIYRSTSANPEPDPVIYLDGGPGGYTLDVLPYTLEDSIEPWLQNRDYITFDQRGIDNSIPMVQCPEITDLERSWLTSQANWEDLKPEYLATMGICRDRLLAEGVDLTGYSSAESAADVDAIRRALGYEQVNLFGVSYGTRLAQTVMRDFPDGVRSVILDSAYPAEADLFENYPRSLNQAFRVFFDSCAADAVCNRQYPDLENRFYAVVDVLNEDPKEIEVTNFLTGQTYDSLFWGDDLIGMLFQTLYSESMFINMPDIIDDLENGEFEDAIEVTELFFVNDDFFSGAVYRTIQCREEYPFSVVANAEVAIQSNPRLIDYFDDYAFTLESCEVWGAGTADPIENRPVVSDIPTLILAGGFDPVTPPSWGKSLQANLSQSYFVEIPQLAHGIFSVNDCTRQIGLDFVARPTEEPSSACTANFLDPVFSSPD
ncbi:MAG: pimeloyl-ACP methyl ester carboxylesterase [Cellvibrionaceae bacterium]|jgi:pimeloyl-ACP methyl ester carboxylesterase